MNIKKYILALCLTFAGHLTHAQFIINGKITDSKNKTALSEVDIYIPELRRNAISNEHGEFSINNLPQVTLTIQFNRIGFKSIVKQVGPETTSGMDVQMESSSKELEEVLVTASSTKLSDQTPFPARSISQNEIRKYASPSLMGNLSYQPGIDKITIGNGIGKPVIRGLSFNRILLYSQGTRIENQQWDDHHDLGLSDVGVQNVELARGPAALIYGADALGGALIFTDENPAPSGSTVGDMNVGFGSNTIGINLDAGIKGTKSNGFFYGIRLGGNSQTSYVQGEDENEVKVAGEEEEFAPNSKFMSTTGKVNVGWSKKWGVSKLSYSFLNQQIGIIEDESGMAKTVDDEAEQRDREMEAPYQDVTTHIISSENTLFVGTSKLNLNLAYQRNDRKEFEPMPDKQKELAIGFNLNTVTYDVKWTSNESKTYGISIGSQGTFLKNENNGLESLVPDADVKDVAGYGLFRYDHKKFNVLAGIRFDSRSIEAESYEKNAAMETDTFILFHSNDTINKPEADFEKEYQPVSFSAGIAYHVNDAFTIKLNGATGFSAPNYAQLATFGKHEGTYRFERGYMNLKAEQNYEGDLGLSFNNDFVGFEVSGYMNNVKSYTYIIHSGDSMVRITGNGRDTLPLYDYRQGDATLTGAEISFDIHPPTAKWFDFKTSYAFINGKLDKGGKLPYIPSNKLIGEVKLSKNNCWKFSDAFVSVVVSNYQKKNKVADYELASDSYTLLDLFFGGSFKWRNQKATINLYCTNVLNAAYYNQLSLVKYIGVKDMGRNIGFQLHIPFGIKNKSGAKKFSTKKMSGWLPDIFILSG